MSKTHTDTNKTEIKQHECFIITPIGENNSAIRCSTDGLVNECLKPVLKEFNYNTVVAHEMSETGSITNQIMEQILNCELVIANLTGLNPNVMYELGVRHSAAMNTIHVCEENTKLPFDIISERTIFYKDSFHSAEIFRIHLRKALQTISKDTVYNNPVYNAKRLNSIMKESPSGELNANQLIIEQIQHLQSQIISLKSQVRTDYSMFRTLLKQSTVQKNVRQENNDFADFFKNFPEDE